MAKLLSLVRSGPIDGTFQGGDFRFHYFDNGTELGALLNPSYNQEEIDFLRRNIPKGGTFIDIGANIGLYAIVISKHVGPNGRVIAIEPHPTASERLKFNCSASNLTNLEVAQVAVAASPGRLMIVSDENNLGASRVGNSGVTVSREPLTTILAERKVSTIDALKIDVEGYEDQALAPFFRDAPPSLWPRSVVIEHLSHGEWQTDCLTLMMGLGYKIEGKTRSNTMLVGSAN
ncbi:FkbM family methyltransferase [Nitrobacter sp. TKz-YC02]|uniref:FkbM family methyltransferase n=1 Tax=Nitrobacter sp. TKz-YC02 TaxID=3398704 RepID=UPI003CFB6667